MQFNFTKWVEDKETALNADAAGEAAAAAYKDQLAKGVNPKVNSIYSTPYGHRPKPVGKPSISLATSKTPGTEADSPAAQGFTGANKVTAAIYDVMDGGSEIHKAMAEMESGEPSRESQQLMHALSIMLIKLELTPERVEKIISFNQR
jgi:hypothetical protein